MQNKLQHRQTRGTRIAHTLFLVSLIAFSSTLPAETKSFSSGRERNTLLELYTSEGCSSCPPADRWLSKLKNDPDLWQTLFPIALHVDYWNYLGWADRFSKADYSQRQRRYALNRYTKTVYTPGFFTNGREWRGWFRRQAIPRQPTPKVGILSTMMNSETITATFNPPTNHGQPLMLNLAVLGFDIKTDVGDGENEGRELEHNFVVLALEQHRSTTENQAYQWRLQNPLNRINLPNGVSNDNVQAIAVWVTSLDDPTPIQVTGGKLK